MYWKIIIRSVAQKQLNRLPSKDHLKLKKAIEEFYFNPLVGDVKKMTGEENVWRRRVGSYRIFYEIIEKESVVYIYDITRRTSSTY